MKLAPGPQGKAEVDGRGGGRQGAAPLRPEALLRRHLHHGLPRPARQDSLPAVRVHVACRRE
jgi:hypothetical protein